MTAPGRVMETRPVRFVVAMAAVGFLIATRVIVRGIERAYPLDHGVIGNALLYVLLAGLMGGIACFTLGAWIAPGWILARLGWPAESGAPRALRAVVIAFPLHALALAAILTLTGGDAAPETFRRYLLGVQAFLLAGCALVPRPAQVAGGAAWSRQRLLLLAAFAVGLVLVLLPAIAWTDYNPDGIETLALGRSLDARLVARLPNGALPPTDLAMFTAAYPIAWLVAVCGLGETAARLPVIWYALALATGVAALAEWKARRALSRNEFGLMLAGTAAVVLTLAMNTAYDPYSTDIASPASIDLLALVFLLATIWFVFAGSAVWVAASAALMSLTRPTAVPLFLLLAAAAFVVERNWRSPRFRLALVAVVAALAVSIAHALARHDPGGSLSRVRYLRFDDWQRLGYLLIPCGVIPVVAWIGWKKMDDWSREIALVVIGYFAFFYCMAFYALHHFAPAMLLPLVTFWRSEAQRESPGRGPWRAAIVLGAIVAIAAALPRDFTAYRDSRRIAAGLSYEVGDYARNFEGGRRSFTGVRALGFMFASPFIADPQSIRINESYALIHYAALQGQSESPPQYVVRDSARTPPEGMTSKGTRNRNTLYVRDTARWERERATPPPHAPRSRWYDVPRTSLFSNLGLEAGIVQLDLLAVARRLRDLTR